MEKIRSLFRNKKGQSMMEMAFIAPMILFIFMSAFDIAMYQVARIELMSATRDTIRILMLNEPKNAKPNAQKVLSFIASKYNNGALTIRNHGNDPKLSPNMEAGTNLNDPMLVELCGEVKLTTPYKGIWGNLNRNGKKDVCISYFGVRHTTDKE